MINVIYDDISAVPKLKYNVEEFKFNLSMMPDISSAIGFERGIDIRKHTEQNITVSINIVLYIIMLSAPTSLRVANSLALFVAIATARLQ